MVYTDWTYKSNTDFMDGIYDQLNQKFENHIPKDLYMDFYIADIPNSIFKIFYFHNQKKDLITNEPYNGSYYEHLEIIGEIQLLRLSTKIRFISSINHNFSFY